MNVNETAVDFDRVRQDCRRLLDSFDSVLLATVDRHGTPEASYAAYVTHQGDYYLYISELAAHTRNLLANGRVSLLFIEDESKAAHLFARQRVTLQGTAEEVERGSDPFRVIMGKFEQKFGSIIDVLKTLRDFHLFRIHPITGAYVQGFARAFVFQPETVDDFRHLNGSGHNGSAAAPEGRSAADD